MEIEKIAMPRKRRLVAALIIFLVTSLAAVILNSFMMGYGLEVERSISRYVGFEIWSSVIFAFGNFFAAGATGAFLWCLGELWELPRVYYYCVIVMVLGLIGLSLCPIGLFDMGGEKSIVSLIHELASRTMFIMMMVVAGLLALRPYGTRGSRVVCWVYVVYGLFCVVGYLTKGSWFIPYCLFFETFYIAAFVLVLLVQKDKRVSSNKTKFSE
mgnify:FL=1